MASIHLPNWKWINELKKAPSPSFKFWKKLLLSLAILILMFITQISIGFLADKTGLYKPSTLSSRTMKYFDNPLLLITGIVVAPITEELIFRKLFFQLFLKKYHYPVIFALISSFLFGLAHSGFIIPYIISGLLLCYLTYKTQRIIYPMLVHTMFNGLLILLSMGMGG
ncbi:CPBP family intramembrane metalloprotease [Staphylococcus epidermidis]|nr:CPBP family intramembrane metalloprotease [Staphylococcus epidermidis]